jgi:hypothetical protein
MALANLDVRRQAELVLRLPAAQRAQLLLESPKPMALVRTIPDGDFYLTVREVDPLDALPLLALASASQIAHLLDLESWRGDRFDALRCGAWVALLVEAGESTIRRFARAIDDDTLILLFRSWARVKPLDIDHEEPTRGHGISDVGDERGFISPDGANMFSPERTEHAIAARRLAEVLYLDDNSRYLGIIRSALFELPSEVEETALHWRASRLEEHGYPTWEEALSIYAAPEGPAVLEAPPETAPEPEGEALVAPRTALRVLDTGTLVVSGAEALSGVERERVLFALTAVANRVLVADGDDAGSPASHARVLLRAGSYVGLAIDRRGARDAAGAARILVEVPVLELFREGYAQASALQARAHRIAKARELIDVPLRARILALLLPRPLYIELGDGDESAAARDFRSMREIDETLLTLELLETLEATLLTRRGTTAADILREERRPFEDVPRFSTLLLTALAWHATRGETRIDRLPSDLVADFLRTTASRRTADPGAPAHAMDKLIETLATNADLARGAAAALHAFGTTCLDRLAADCGSLDPGTPVTPREVGCLRLA